MLAAAVRARKNIVVAGGTSTGKTTFLNALLREVPAEERLILIEDTPELFIRHANAVGLLAARGSLGEAQVNANDLLSASLRMRPDRIILGELRGEEAFAFLRAINTGHPGSMTTVHADSPERAIEQIVLLTLQAGTQLGREHRFRFLVLEGVRQQVAKSTTGGTPAVRRIKGEKPGVKLLKRHAAHGTGHLGAQHHARPTRGLQKSGAVAQFQGRFDQLLQFAVLTLQKFGDHDWYLEGAKSIVRSQKDDGSWGTNANEEKNTVSTCFAILFLKKATKEK